MLGGFVSQSQFSQLEQRNGNVVCRTKLVFWKDIVYILVKMPETLTRRTVSWKLRTVHLGPWVRGHSDFLCLFVRETYKCHRSCAFKEGHFWFVMPGHALHALECPVRGKHVLCLCRCSSRRLCMMPVKVSCCNVWRASVWEGGALWRPEPLPL